jgi:NDP-sugar pyrophosphorylase family protein
VDDGATIEAPCFVGDGAVVAHGARVAAYSAIGARCDIGPGAVIDGAILWPGTRVGEAARIGPILAGRRCEFGAHVQVGGDAMFGDESIVTDYSRLGN